MSNSIIHPDFIRIVERQPGGWAFKVGTVFYKRYPISVDLQDFEMLYGISKQKIVIELFRLNGGKAGYYLADLRHKRFYYCGLNWDDVRNTLLSLGIGRTGFD